MSKTYGPYASAREAAGLVFVAGQVGVNPQTKEASADFEDQLVQALENLSSVLGENSLSLHDVVNVRVYLTDINLFETMNKVYERYFEGIAPSRECVGVASLPKVAKNAPLLVEVSAVASRGSHG